MGDCVVIPLVLEYDIRKIAEDNQLVCAPHTLARPTYRAFKARRRSA